MPTVQELLNDIDVLLPNTFTTAQKLVWMNEAQRLLFKYMNSMEVYEFTTVADQATYNMASDCTIDLIDSVQLCTDSEITVDSIFYQYRFVPLNAEFTGNNYYEVPGGLIGLYPVPEETGYNVKIFYNKRPVLLSASDLTVTPNLNEDYQPALKSYTLSKIAKAGNNPDVELANNYMIEFNNYMGMMFQDWAKNKAKVPRNSRANRWW